MDGRAEHVLRFVLDLDQSDRDGLEAELERGAQALAPVQDLSGLIDLDRDEQAAFLDVSPERVVLALGHQRDEFRVGVLAQLSGRAGADEQGVGRCHLRLLRLLTPPLLGACVQTVVTVRR